MTDGLHVTRVGECPSCHHPWERVSASPHGGGYIRKYHHAGCTAGVPRPFAGHADARQWTEEAQESDYRDMRARGDA